MRETVRIEERTPLRDAAGQPAETWLLKYERRAAIVRSTGREVETQGQRQGRVPTVFQLRYLSDVVPGMRLVCRSKVYDIRSAIDPEGLGRKIEITAEELVEEAV